LPKDGEKRKVYFKTQRMGVPARGRVLTGHGGVHGALRMWGKQGTRKGRGPKPIQKGESIKSAERAALESGHLGNVVT